MYYNIHLENIDIGLNLIFMSSPRIYYALCSTKGKHCYDLLYPISVCITQYILKLKIHIQNNK